VQLSSFKRRYPRPSHSRLSAPERVIRCPHFTQQSLFALHYLPTKTNTHDLPTHAPTHTRKHAYTHTHTHTHTRTHTHTEKHLWKLRLQVIKQVFDNVRGFPCKVCTLWKNTLIC
jgi:hypothetical protein